MAGGDGSGVGEEMRHDDEDDTRRKPLLPALVSLAALLLIVWLAWSYMPRLVLESGDGDAAPASSGAATADTKGLIEDATEPVADIYPEPDSTDTGSTSSESGVPAQRGEVSVPRLVGLSESEALKKLRAAELDPRPIYQPIKSSIGAVYQQDPAPGTTVKVGRKVFVLIGSLD